MWAIYKRELRSYFITPIGYIFAGMFIAVSGALFAYTTLLKQDSSGLYTYFVLLLLVFCILLPLLTMKLFAEEKKLLATFFLLPNATGSEFSITYQYTEKDKNNNTTVQSIKMEHQAFPSTDNWLPGTSVGYTIGIARKAISVTPEDSAVLWEDDTATEIVTGTEG